MNNKVNSKCIYFQDCYLLISLAIASLFFAIGIWEIVIVSIFKWQNKNNYEYNAYIFTLTKSILNILFSFLIVNIIYYKKNNKFFKVLIFLIILVTDIWLINLFSDLKNYGVYEQVIIVEFIILYIESMIIMILFIFFVIRSNFFDKPTRQLTEPVISNNNDPIIITISEITIPQLAIPNNLLLHDNVELPQAKPFLNEKDILI